MVPDAIDQPAGRLVIISGPSGAGKSTLLQRLMDTCPLPLDISISATTRAPRPGETDGVSYHFLSPDEFQNRLAAGDFLEHKEVFGRGHWYGTLRSPVTTGLKQGKWVILEIDVAGAADVVAQITGAITVFVHPGSLAELERRLRDRGTEPEDAIQSRLAQAQRELAAADRYHHIVINDQLDRAVQELSAILVRQGE